MIIGIDASRNRSGGARAHLIGLLSNLDPYVFGIKEINVWSYSSLLDSIPNQKWLVKHNPAALQCGLLHQLLWQLKDLHRELNRHGCNILFTTDASTLCKFIPMVVLSQDMLSYEPGVMESYGFSIARLRLEVILRVQNLAFKRSTGVIFLTKYACNVISAVCGGLNNVSIIPHGVDNVFFASNTIGGFPNDLSSELSCVYVSPVAKYKHQVEVVIAISKLRDRGIPIRLKIVGRSDCKYGLELTEIIKKLDPKGVWVDHVNGVNHEDLPGILSLSHIFIFVSECENLPVTLLEGMAFGLPIVCSTNGPMPEILQDGGVYCNPNDVNSIADAVFDVISNSEVRNRISMRARSIASEYSWRRCAEKTFSFVVDNSSGKSKNGK